MSNYRSANLFIVLASEPYMGFAQSVILNPVHADGSADTSQELVAYSQQGRANTDYLTFEEYCVAHPDKTFVKLDMAQMDVLDSLYYGRFWTQPTQISRERYDEMLNVLPPCRWSTQSGVEIFHISERLTGKLVNWYGRSGDQYATMIRPHDLPGKEIAGDFVRSFCKH